MILNNFKFKDICLSISDGDHLAPPKSDEGVPFITISNITSQNQLDFSNTTFVPFDYYEKLDEKRKARKYDILYSVVGTFGKPVLIKNNFKFAFQRHIAILRPNTEFVDPIFLYYIMSSRTFYKIADTIAIGAAQRTITLTSLRNLKIDLPPLEIQNRIASILSRYDDLIENYQHQIQLLEEAAQRLYKEWFVDLHFPGYENTNIVDGVPEGWEKKKLIDVVDVQYGYSFNGSLFNTKKEGMPILRIRNIPNGISEDYTTEDASENYIVKDGEIVVGMDGEFHINIWSGGPAYLVQRACCMRPKDDTMRGFILEAIYTPIKFFEKTLVGATVAHLGKKHIDSIEILVPSKKIFFDIFSNMLKQRLTILKQIRLLTEARDRLLPKLMSGEITV